MSNTRYPSRGNGVFAGVEYRRDMAPLAMNADRTAATGRMHLETADIANALVVDTVVERCWVEGEMWVQSPMFTGGNKRLEHGKWKQVGQARVGAERSGIGGQAPSIQWSSAQSGGGGGDQCVHAAAVAN